MKYVIGLDIGGTKCAVTVGSANKCNIDVLKKQAFATNGIKTADEFFERVFNIINSFKAEYIFEAIGISCGGPLDETKGIIICPPHLPLLHGVKISEILTDRYNVPVYLRNDANACALAEWLFGAGVGTKNMAFLTFGTGLGAGLILDGRLYSGTNGNAGEIGHIRLSPFGPSGFGKVGSLEGFCSGKGLAQLGYTLGLEAVQKGITPAYFKDGITADITAKDIAIAADSGDKTALEVYAICGRYLGLGLSVLIDILNPERIVIGSIYQRSENLLSEYAKESIKKEALRVSAECCDIVPAKLKNDIGDIAALSVAVYGR